MNKTRRGKIAKLPREVREQLNRRLADGAEGDALLDWLNELPETRAVLNEKFGGQPITHSNLSLWRLGGYSDWTTHQEALAEVESFVDEATEMNVVQSGSVTDRLALWLASRYALAARKLGQEGGTEEADWKLLRELSHDLVALRRGDHGEGWLRVEEKRLDAEIKERERRPEEEFLKWVEIPEVRESICRGFKTHEEKLALMRKVMFGRIEELCRQKHKPVPGEARRDKSA